MRTDNLAGKRICMYARYSTDEQLATSIDDQVDFCVERVRRLGASLNRADVYQDSAISGATLGARPGVRRLMADVRARRWDVLVVESLSRLSRNEADTHSMIRDLEFFDVRFIALQDNIDTSDPNSGITITFSGAKEAMYLKGVAQQTRRSLEARAKNGFVTGKLPYGYRSIAATDGSNRKVAVIEAGRAAVVRRTFKMFLQGSSPDRIAEAINADGIAPPEKPKRQGPNQWSYETVRTLLRNEKYVGVWRYNQSSFRKHPVTGKRVARDNPESEHIVDHLPELAIIDRETWERAQCLIEERAQKHGGQTKGRTNNRSLPLSGLLSCGVCGGNFVMNGGSNHVYYRCVNGKKENACENNESIRDDRLRRALVAFLKATLASPANLDYVRKAIAGKTAEHERTRDSELHAARQALQSTEKKIERLIELLVEDGASRHLNEARKGLERTAAEQQRRVEELKSASAAMPRLLTPEQALASVFNFEALLDQAPDAAREALRSLLQGSTIRLYPRPGRQYRLKATLLPLGFLDARAEPQSKTPLRGASQEAVYHDGCGGWI